jgi:hypothetical protein
MVINKASASVDVTTSAEGQAVVSDTLQLVYEGGRYRVSRLSQ